MSHFRLWYTLRLASGDFAHTQTSAALFSWGLTVAWSLPAEEAGLPCSAAPETASLLKYQLCFKSSLLWTVCLMIKRSDKQYSSCFYFKSAWCPWYSEHFSDCHEHYVRDTVFHICQPGNCSASCLLSSLTPRNRQETHSNYVIHSAFTECRFTQSRTSTHINILLTF